MQQTLLALVALMTVTFLNFNQTQSKLHHQKEVVRSEMEGMAASVAMQTIGVIRTRAFDAKTVNVSKDEIDGPEDFTDPDFTIGNQCKAFFPDTGAVCSDVDDFHKMNTAIVPFKTPEFEVQFKVDVEVQYVNQNLQPVAQRTYRKKVIVKVQDRGENPHLPKPIQFSEVLTFY
jgi:hypothetical protein